MIYVVIRAWPNDYEILGVFNSLAKLESFLKSLESLENVQVDKTFMNVKVITANSKPATEYV